MEPPPPTIRPGPVGGVRASYDDLDVHADGADERAAVKALTDAVRDAARDPEFRTRFRAWVDTWER